MARRLGIGERSLSKIEKGILPPRLMLDVLFVMERDFGVESYRFFREGLEK